MRLGKEQATGLIEEPIETPEESGEDKARMEPAQRPDVVVGAIHHNPDDWAPAGLA